MRQSAGEIGLSTYAGNNRTTVLEWTEQCIYTEIERRYRHVVEFIFSRYSRIGSVFKQSGRSGLPADLRAYVDQPL